MSTGAAGPAGREGQPGPAGREGDAGKAGREGAVGAPGPVGPEGVEGHEGPQGEAGPPGPIGAIIDLTTAQEDLAAAVRALTDTQAESTAATKMLLDVVRRLIWLVAACLIGVIVFGLIHFRLSTLIRDEGLAGRQSFKCVIGVLFRQDPPACPNEKEKLIEEGIIPPGFPSTTSTTL